MFENIAYIMAKHADSGTPDTTEEWLDGFGSFSIYQVLPKIIELWWLNVQAQAEAKKTLADRAGNDHPAFPAAVRPARHKHQRAGTAHGRDDERDVH